MITTVSIPRSERKDEEMLAYIEKNLQEPWRGFVYSEVEWLLGKLKETRAKLAVAEAMIAQKFT